MTFKTEQIISISCCPICDGVAQVVAQMPDYPITEIYKDYGSNDYIGPRNAHQSLRYCEGCQHLFIGEHLPRDFLYAHYVTESSASRGAQIALDHFYDFISAKSTISSATIIDIGANDTSLLERFVNKSAKLIGIDPNISSDNPQIQCVKGYVEDCDLNSLTFGRRIFLCSHTLEHIYNPRAFLKQLSSVVKVEDDLFMQFPSFELLVRDGRFDQVHHQHLNYFSLKSISKLLGEFGLRIDSYHFDSDHYGALICHIRRGGASIVASGFLYNFDDVMTSYLGFRQCMTACDLRIETFAENFYCFGASLMLPILGYYLPSLDRAKSIIDSSKTKHGLTYINFERPIISDGMIDYKNCNLVITAVATKAAARQVTKFLIEREALNIVFPINML